MTGALVVSPRQKFDRIEEAIRAREDDIVATLVPTIPRDRFLKIALQAITRSPSLLDCTPASFVLALRDAAELGLEPSGLMGSAYLVPYRNKKSGKMEAQLIPGYRGLIDLARRSGEVRTVEAHVVRERDEFSFGYGSDQYLHHVPYLNMTGAEDDEGKPLDAGEYVAAYAFARLASGEVQFDVMDVPELDKIRAQSKAADKGPWATHWAEMARKTPTRRLLKYLPLSVVALTRALELEDIAEGQSEPERPEKSQARTALQAALKVETPDEEPPVETEDREAEEGEFFTDDELDDLTREETDGTA